MSKLQTEEENRKKKEEERQRRNRESSNHSYDPSPSFYSNYDTSCDSNSDSCGCD